MQRTLKYTSHVTGVVTILAYDDSKRTAEQAAHVYAIRSSEWYRLPWERPEPEGHTFQCLGATDLVSALVEAVQ